MSFVLLDIGGTYIKCRLSDSENISKVRTPAFLPNLAQNIKEFDPFQIIELINDLLNQVTQSNKNIDGILISGQMHGWIITDSECNPITNLVTWQDTRSLIVKDFFRNLQNSISQEDQIICGNEIKVGSPVVGIAYSLKFNKISRYRIFSLLSWISYQITHESRFIMNITDAAAFSFVNLKSNDWHKNVVSSLNIEFQALPTITTNIEIIGISKQFGCPVYTPIGDYQASLLGSEIKIDEISLNIATGGQVSKISKIIGEYGMQTRPYFNGTFLATKTHLPAGRHANYILSKFRNGDISSNWKLINNIDVREIENSLSKSPGEIDIHELYINDMLTNFEDLELLIRFFELIVLSYSSTVTEFNRKKNYKIIGSGGMLSNSNFVRKLFELNDNLKFDKIVLNQDASLNGLELISKQI